MDDDSTKTSPKTILIVDDDQFITIAYKAGFEQVGYAVMVANDGEEAIKQMTAKRPDLVLLDIMMPKVDGFEVLQAIKATKGLADIPIVIFTNLSQESDEKTARAYGAADFLTKANVSLNDVLARVERLLDKDANYKQ